MTSAEVAVLQEQLQTVDENVCKILKHLEGSNGTPGLIIEVDRLKQKDMQRTWWIRTLAAAMCGIGLQSLATRFGWF